MKGSGCILSSSMTVEVGPSTYSAPLKVSVSLESSSGGPDPAASQRHGSGCSDAKWPVRCCAGSPGGTEEDCPLAGGGTMGMAGRVGTGKAQ